MSLRNAPSICTAATVLNRNSAIRIFERFLQQEYQLNSYAELTAERVILHGLGYIMNNFVKFLANPNLKIETGSHIGNNYATTTLEKYLEWVHGFFYEKFHSGPSRREIFEDVNKSQTEMTASYKAKLSKLIKNRDRMHGVTTADTTKMPLWKKITRSLTTWGSGADLHSVATKLLEEPTTDPLTAATNRFKVVLTYHAAGRSGEAKFMRYRDWSWVTLFGVLSVNWGEVKTIQDYLISFCVDNDSYATCFLHSWAVACLFGFLQRDTGQRLSEADYIFQKDMDCSRQGFTQKVTTIIKNNVPQEYRRFLSGKSLRSAAISFLHSCGLLMPSSILIRSGHASADNTKHYTFGTLAGTMPGMKILAGYPRPHGTVPVPRMMALCTGQQRMLDGKEDIFRLIDLLYPRGDQLPFKRDEKLSPLLEVVTAVLYMSYNEMKPTAKDGNLAEKVVVKLQQAAIRARLATAANVVATLGEWSTVLKIDFDSIKDKLLICEEEQQNGATGTLGVTLLRAVEKVNECHDKIIGTQQQLNRQMQSNDQLLALQETVIQLKQSNNLLHAQNLQLQGQNEQILHIFQRMASGHALSTTNTASRTELTTVANATVGQEPATWVQVAAVAQSEIGREEGQGAKRRVSPSATDDGPRRKRSKTLVSAFDLLGQRGQSGSTLPPKITEIMTFDDPWLMKFLFRKCPDAREVEMPWVNDSLSIPSSLVSSSNVAKLQRALRCVALVAKEEDKMKFTAADRDESSVGNAAITIEGRLRRAFDQLVPSKRKITFLTYNSCNEKLKANFVVGFNVLKGHVHPQQD